MSHLESFTDALTQEVLVDAAESFFGSRKRVEDEVELFCSKVQTLKKLEATVLQRAHALHALLLDVETAHEFYFAVGARPCRLIVWADPAQAEPLYSVPWALTRKGRFAKFVLHHYMALQDAVDLYMNGRYYTDHKHGGRKRLTLHYTLMREWAGNINQRIRKVNECHSPSCVLNFAKSMNQDTLNNERITEATMDGYACKLDEDLAIPLVDCMGLDLKEFPNLPPPDTVRKPLLQFARRLYKARPADAADAMQRLNKPKQNS